MNIILTENVENLGTIGEVVTVKPGYARNFLIPGGFAVEANPRNVKALDHQKRQLERKLHVITSYSIHYTKLYEAYWLNIDWKLPGIVYECR